MTTPPPSLPSLLTAPLHLVPSRAHSLVLATALNRLFTDELADGEFDFLEGKVFAIEVRDAPVCCRITLRRDRFSASSRDKADATVSATVHDFLLLMAQQEDPDTLFFQRRLLISGEADLGLEVKNLLDAVDPEQLPAVVRELLPRAVDFSQKLLQLLSTRSK